jgi:hypothetical protein
MDFPEVPLCTTLVQAKSLFPRLGQGNLRRVFSLFRRIPRVVVEREKCPDHITGEPGSYCKYIQESTVPYLR